MIITNVEVYGLDESIVASSYPMLKNRPTEDEFKYELDNLKYWDEQSIKQIVKILDEDDRFSLIGDEVIMTVKNAPELKFKISAEDLIRISELKWSYNKGRGYVRSTTNNIELHRFICDSPLNKVVDHIDRDKLNYKRNNLRICEHRENSINKDIAKNNSSGFTGVYWNKQKNKWDSKIEVNSKKITIGRYDNKYDAICARLNAEYELFGEFSPQRHLFEEYGISKIKEKNIEENHVIIPMLARAIRNLKRSKNLSSCEIGTAHDVSLQGIIVQFDVDFTIKAWVEAQRYHFLDFVSSMSTMHKLTSFELDDAYVEYVDPRMIDIMNELKDSYNENKTIENKLKLIYSNPVGMKLTARMTTNYRQLKTIFSQRNGHLLPEWHTFCEWIENLPYFVELTGIERKFTEGIDTDK